MAVMALSTAQIVGISAILNGINQVVAIQHSIDAPILAAKSRGTWNQAVIRIIYACYSLPTIGHWAGYTAGDIRKFGLLRTNFKLAPLGSQSAKLALREIMKMKLLPTLYDGRLRHC